MAVLRKRRKLRLTSLALLQTELNRLSQAPPTPVGNWTAGQIYWHLAEAFRATMQGGIYQPPQWRDWTMAPIKYFLLYNWFPSGIPVPPQVRKRLTPPATADAATALVALQELVPTFADHTGPLPRHPVLGTMSKAQWTLFHLRHCELHLSFLVD